MKILRHPHEEGSAYIVALLVLLVLTVLGLSLALVTQSELQIGTNEKTIHRVFYGAEAGVAVSTAKVLVANDFSLTAFEFKDEAPNPLNFRVRVETTPLVPILEAPCNLCEINNAGSANSEYSYSRINHAVTSEATRLGGGSDIPLGRKTISSMIDIQPIRSLAKDKEVLAQQDYTGKIKL